MTRQITVQRWENVTTQVTYEIEVSDDFDLDDEWFEPWTYPMRREHTEILDVNDTGEWKEVKP